METRLGFRLTEQEGNLLADACFRWTTTAWAPSRKVTVHLKSHFFGALNTLKYFPTKNVLHDRFRTVSMQVFSCRFFSSRFFSSFVNCKNSTPKATVYWIRLIFSGKAIHFYGLISKLMVTLVKEEMYRSNLQLLKRQKVMTSLSLMRFHRKKGGNFIPTMLLIHTSLVCFADRRYPTLTPSPPPSRFLKLKQLTMQASWIKWFLVQVYSFTTIYLSVALKLWVINCKITISINLSVFSHKYA